MALLFAELGEFRLREGLARLVDGGWLPTRRSTRFLRGSGGEASIDAAVARLLLAAARGVCQRARRPRGLCRQRTARMRISICSRAISALLLEDPALSPAIVQALLERVREHLLTQSGEPRKRLTYRQRRISLAARLRAARRGGCGARSVSGGRADQSTGATSTSCWRARCAGCSTIALEQYERTLRKHGVLDFPEVLERTLTLLAQMDEFSRSRYKLEARYQHVLVDEFQDTSRAQWELVELLVRSWAEGAGSRSTRDRPADDLHRRRSQAVDLRLSRRRGRGARRGARYIEALRPIGQVRTAITRSFRSVRELLAFVNDLFARHREGAGARRRIPVRRRRRVSGGVGRGQRARAARRGRARRPTKRRRRRWPKRSRGCS